MFTDIDLASHVPAFAPELEENPAVGSTEEETELNVDFPGTVSYNESENLARDVAGSLQTTLRICSHWPRLAV